MSIGPKTPFDLLNRIQNDLQKKSELVDNTSATGWQGVLFTVANRYFITPVNDVAEIIPMPSVLAIPGVQSWVRGVIQIRGELVIINDLGGFLFNESATPDQVARVMIIEHNHEKIGFLLSKVDKMIMVQENHMVKVPNDGFLAEYALNAVIVKGGHIPMIELKKLAQHPSFLQGSRMAT